MLQHARFAIPNREHGYCTDDNARALIAALGARRLYAQVANLYRASDRLELDENFLYGAAAASLKTDADFSAAIALTFRLQLIDMFFIGDLYAKTGVITDPKHPPRVADSLADVQRDLRARPFADYFTGVFSRYYLQRRPDATSAPTSRKKSA